MTQLFTFLGICPKDSTFYSTDTCSVTIIAVLLTIATKWKEDKCLSSDKWIVKMWFTYTME